MMKNTAMKMAMTTTRKETMMKKEMTMKETMMKNTAMKMAMTTRKVTMKKKKKMAMKKKRKKMVMEKKRKKRRKKKMTVKINQGTKLLKSRKKQHSIICSYIKYILNFAKLSICRK